MNIEEIERLDQSDPLKAKAEEFYLPDGQVYLDGNSLGAMPLAAKQRLQDVVTREWGEDLIHSWNDNDWFIQPGRIGDKIAQLIGADEGEVIVSDCVSVNIFKSVMAALKLQGERTQIVTELGNFPTNLYVLQGIEKMLGGKVELVAVERERVLESISEKTAIVVLTHTHYKTSEVFDMAEYTDCAHQQGAMILWDLCHSAGVMPLDLAGLDVDMSVGCGYKYLNGGPGAPAFVSVASRLQAKLEQPVSGWWSHAMPFAFNDQYSPAEDIRQMQSGTQSVLGLAALEVGIDMALSVDMSQVREKSSALGQVFIKLVKAFCPELEIASPIEDEHRGSHVSISHGEGYAITQALRQRGITVDFRAPDIIRFGFAPLYNSYRDCWDTVQALREILQSGEWDEPQYKQKATVT